jgi:outer membrane protein
MKFKSSIKFKSCMLSSFRVSTLVWGMSLPLLGTASAKEMKFAIIDVQRALISVEMGKKAKADLEKEINNRQKAIESAKSTFEKSREDYAKRSSVMSDEARKKKEEELQKQYMKIQMDQAQLPDLVRKKEQDLSLPIFNKLKVVMDETLKKQGYDYFLEKSAVPAFADPKLEITNEVIAAFDKQHKAGELK